MNIFPLLPTKIRKKHDIAAKNDRKSNQSIKKSLKTGKESAKAVRRGSKGLHPPVGADPCVCPNNNEHPAWSPTTRRGRPLCLPEQQRVAAREIFQKSIPKSFKIIHVQFMIIHV